ncbi:asparagine synthetase B [Bacillus sp. ISL-35]|uniref:asparagine synthase-related protein n=1 Tax=Bacillus sp. ISL-35 TaxID=2819122 RepID=UPI001BE90752|nr:asparagine synthase-related protein [Bacillus sp. ISL-35]MBT2679844.1 asparagine synthetase B [Bacillus sp. ISL-35]MBT2704879.1 asparagine synthetase B [Chryseobacterium sp. ISL-80]
MSAIAGIIHLKKEPVPFEHGRNIMKGLEKFPADDIQVWHKHNAFIGNHAQWITPESVGEQQPFYDSERQCVITADAIIDNREELFEKLQVERSKQKHMPDSQLILLAYYKWGEESPKHLVGDFAYMIWDERNQKLFGARDFSGSRTLYYYKDDERFAFCTTIMPLFTLPGVKKELNEQWLAEYIANPGRFESVEPVLTVYKNIYQIPPSHSITIINRSLFLNRYCDLIPGTKMKLKSDDEYIDAFREVFQKAVDSKLRTHKTVGGHLSGGLDSGSVAAFATKTLRKDNKKLHTFSYVPVEDFVDWTPRSRVANERPLIESTVNYIHDISPNYLSFEDKNPYSEIDNWLETIESPYKFFENTFWLRGIYEEASRKGIGVLLNGQRGNWTISWGSTFDYYALLFKSLRWIKLNQEMKEYCYRFGTGRKRILSNMNRRLLPKFYQSQDLNDEFPIYINKDFSSRTKVYEILKDQGVDIKGKVDSNAYKVKEDHFHKLYYWNTTGTYGTKLSLRYGLVDRDPTNDLRVVRFSLSVPEEQYVQNGLDRALIRRATKGYLPDDIRLNMRKRGIQGADGVHRMTSIWDRFIDEIEKLKSDSLMTGMIDIKVIDKCVAIIKDNPKPELAFEFEFNILMRSLILYRFIKNL